MLETISYFLQVYVNVLYVQEVLTLHINKAPARLAILHYHNHVATYTKK